MVFADLYPDIETFDAVISGNRLVVVIVRVISYDLVLYIRHSLRRDSV